MISSCEKFPIIFEWGWLYSKFNASRADPNGWHFADDNVKCISTQVSIGSGNILVVNRWLAIPWTNVKQVFLWFFLMLNKLIDATWHH